jgi:YVTN family beta-propeller protein
LFQRFIARRRHGLAGLAIGALLGGVLTVVTAAVPANAAGGDGMAYVTNFGNGTVSVIDTASQTVVDTIAVGSGPQGIAVNASGTTAYVANQTSDSVSVIDLGTDTVSATIALPAGFVPNFDVLNTTGTALFVSDLANTTNALVVVINTTNNTITGGIGTGSGDLAYDLAYSSVNKALYIPGAASNSLITSSAAGTTSVAVGTTPTDVAVTPDGSQAYVANNASSSVSVVDLADNAVTATIPTAFGPFGVDFNAAGTRAYVTQSVGQVSVIDTSTQAVLTTVNVGGDPWIPKVDPTGTDLWVPNGGSNTVQLIGLSDNTVDNTITGFDQPHDIAFGPAAQADIAVGVTGQSLQLLQPALQFTVTADNLGPDPVTSATITTSIPPVITATNLSSGCTQSGASVVCAFGAIPVGATAQASFSLPLSLLLIGRVSVTSTRTASTPTDPNPSNDTASASCIVISVLLATC